MHDAAAATTDQTAAPDPQVHIHRKTFERIEGLRTRVAETTIALDRASREHKEAKSAHETAQSNLSVAVSDMLDEVNGISKLPLWAELAAYLDALDARKAAEADGQGELLEPPVPPAFLAEQSHERTDEEVDALIESLLADGLALGADVIRRLSPAQWAEVQAWLGETARIKADKGEALTADDLPAVPSYLLNPAELTAAGDVLDETTPPAAEPKTTARTARRPSSKFQNRPRVVKGKRAGKAH
jgi:hypothetical protein